MEEETNALTRTGTGFTLRVVLDQIICHPAGKMPRHFFGLVSRLRCLISIATKTALKKPCQQLYHTIKLRGNH